MEFISSVTDLLAEIARLETQPFVNHSSLIKGIGNYFFNYEPSQIDDIYIQKIEPYFNDLYKQMAEKGERPDITNATLSVLGTISTQCKKIQKDNLDTEYFITYKLLGEALKNLGELLEQE